ncbi:hypothetical protein ACFQ2M_20405 [Kitasatospora saccharophila]|uniref:hypothetical protein n=1 Tax=Kitasatospora saccharophila TaxID=407973 RepID=UPI0036258DBD
MLTQSAFNALVIGLGAVLAVDPYLVVLLWSNSVGVLGIMVMQALAAVAVFAFFRKDRRGMSAFRVVWAPLLAAAGLAVLAVLALFNFDLLTGRTGLVNWLLLVPLPVVAAAGWQVARRIRRTDPERFARLTEVDVERD